MSRWICEDDAEASVIPFASLDVDNDDLDVEVVVYRLGLTWHCGARLSLGATYKTREEAMAHGESICRVLVGVSEQWLAEEAEPLRGKP